MNHKILIEKLKVTIIVFLSFIILITVESLLILNNYIGILQNILKSPINIGRYFPIIILLYLFTKEIILSFNQNDPLLKFSVTEKGIVFLQDYHLWLAILETSSVGKIQTSELKQLKHLKTFSLELDIKRTCVRVFIYSKSHKELEERIKNSIPILEVVLPDINKISKVEITKMLSEIKLLKNEKKYMLKKNSELNLPQFADSADKFPPSFSKMILACNFREGLDIEENTKMEKFVQWYFFHNYDKASFFKCMNRTLSSSQKMTAESFWNIQELQRIRLRYQIEKKPLFDFQEGLNHFKGGLFLLLSRSKTVRIEGQITDHSLIALPCETKPSPLLSTEKASSFFRMNQICSELCNIPEDDKLLQEEKEKKCHRRAGFCQKLLINDNFSSILENILSQRYETDRIHLITELKSHLSYQQLFCVLAHLTQSSQPEIPNHKIINMICILLCLKYKIQENPCVDTKTVSSIFSDDEAIKQISPSLAPN